MNLKDIEKIIKGQKAHQIRAGRTHRFVDITIVSTEGRFFVRQYKFGQKSWYDTFLMDADGQLKIGDIIIDIDGVVPSDLESINPKINKAYTKLLGLIYPIMRLTYNTKKHEASTIELVPKTYINNSFLKP